MCLTALLPYVVVLLPLTLVLLFFFNDTATTEIYTLSLHDALPISSETPQDELEDLQVLYRRTVFDRDLPQMTEDSKRARSEEHTSELQSPCNLVCRLLLEKKKTRNVPLLDTLETCPTYVASNVLEF